MYRVDSFSSQMSRSDTGRIHLVAKCSTKVTSSGDRDIFKFMPKNTIEEYVGPMINSNRQSFR